MSQWGGIQMSFRLMLTCTCTELLIQYTCMHTHVHVHIVHVYSYYISKPMPSEAVVWCGVQSTQVRTLQYALLSFLFPSSFIYTQFMYIMSCTHHRLQKLQGSRVVGVCATRTTHQTCHIELWSLVKTTYMYIQYNRHVRTCNIKVRK